MNHSDKTSLENDLMVMYKLGLIDVKIREDGQWVYFATEYSKSLTPEQLDKILSSSYDEK
jgi:hypothetical protein